MLSPHIFRAYDIRGVYNRDFDITGAIAIGKGYGSYLRDISSEKENLTIVIGRDGRDSGAELEAAFITGITSAGIDVVQVGMVPSPLLYFAICAGNFAGGVQITASHNPAEYNGFKLQKQEAHAICGEEIQKIWQRIQNEDFVVAAEEGSVRQERFTERYFEKLLRLVQFTTSQQPHVVIDAGNGITGEYAPDFFRQLGCEVTELYCKVDGSFPNHDADPERAENLVDLKKMVQEKNADFGLAFDGDGDRVGLVDSRGEHYSADLLLLLLARDMLSRNKGAAVVFDLKSTEVLSEDITAHGGKPLMCKTGHSFVEEMMQESGALLGGEVSGHLFFAENYYGFDDALLAAAKLVTLLWNSQKPIWEHLANLPQTYITPEQKVRVSEEEKFAIMEKITTHFLQQYPDALTIDGIRIDFGAGAWGIVRASNTSPYLTTRFEARSKKKLEEIQEIIFEHLRKYPEIQNI